MVEEQVKQPVTNEPPIDSPAQEATPAAEHPEPEIIEASASESGEEETEKDVDPKEAKISALETELAEQVELVNAIKRQHGEAIVEFNNARSRLKREVAREVQTNLKGLISELLETLDNLNRAIESEASSGQASELLTGVTMVRDQFVAKLSQLGVKKIESKDAAFNPNFHEAVSMVPVPSPELDGQIVGVIKDGYTMNDEVLRAAVVAVGQCEAEPEPKEPTAGETDDTEKGTDAPQ